MGKVIKLKESDIIKRIIREEMEDWEWIEETTPESGFLETVINPNTVVMWSNFNFDNVFFIPKDGKNIVVASTMFEYTIWDGEATKEDLVNHFKEHTHVEFYNDMNAIGVEFYNEEIDSYLTLDEQIEELVDMSRLDASTSYYKNSLTLKEMDLNYGMGTINFRKSIEEVIPNIYKVLYVKAGM